MWKAILKDGKEIHELNTPWNEARQLDIVKMECAFGGKEVKITIPKDAKSALMFNTGEMTPGSKVQRISQSIGYSTEDKEYFVRLTYDGKISYETSPIIH